MQAMNNVECVNLFFRVFFRVFFLRHRLLVVMFAVLQVHAL